MAPTEIPRADSQEGDGDGHEPRRPRWWPPDEPAEQQAGHEQAPEGRATDTTAAEDHPETSAATAVDPPAVEPSQPVEEAPVTDEAVTASHQPVVVEDPPVGDQPVVVEEPTAAEEPVTASREPAAVEEPSAGDPVAAEPREQPVGEAPPVTEPGPAVDEPGPPSGPDEPVGAAGAPVADEAPHEAREPDEVLPRAGRARALAVEEVVVRRRDRFLPRSVLGVTALALAFAVGAAFSGAILYSYYEFKKDTTERRVATFVEGFDQRFDTALATIEAEANNARAEIQKELEPLRKTRAEGQTLEALIKKVEPSTFFVSTLDEAGQPSVGTAFAVASDNQQTLLVTSYATIKAATRQPGPPVRVRKGNTEIRSTLWTWDESKDLALITLSRGNVPTLSFASEQLRPGERVFAVSAIGGAGGSVTQGFVADVSASGIAHDAAVGQAFQGGPLVNSEGRVLGVASRSYAPLGFTSDQVYFAPFVRAACERVLRCSGGAPGAGDRGTSARR